MNTLCAWMLALLPAAAAPAASEWPTPDQVTARSLTRVALVDLKLCKTPGRPEFTVATDLLAIAHGLQPADQDILRLLIEAATQVGDQDRVAALTRNLLVLDPADTVAQLNLISANVSRLQEADSRIRAYEQFIGPRGEALDASVRSRLALDCALLLRERGDAAGFESLLRQAITLDATNKDAAALLVTYVTQRGDSAERRLEAVLLLLMADPLDPATHLEIARHLHAAGAHRGAVRFFGLYQAIMGMYKATIPTPIIIEVRVATWEDQGPAPVVAILSDALLKPRKRLAEALEEARATGTPEADVARLGKPSDIRLMPEIERLFLMAASAAGDAAAVRIALGEIDVSYRKAEGYVKDPASRPAQLTEEAARTIYIEQKAAAAWCRLIAGAQTDEADRLIEEIRAEGLLGAPAMARFTGWLLVRKGMLPEAREVLTPLADADVLARLGLAAAAETAGDRVRAAELYGQCAAALSPSVTGAWARTKASLLLEGPPPPGPSAAALEAMARGVPAWIDNMVGTPEEPRGTAARRFEAIGAELVKTVGVPGDKAMLRLTIRNLSPIPLPVGSEKPLNSRWLLGPSIDIGPRRVPSATAEVVSLDRRLRLGAREAFTVEVWADPGYNGYFSDMAAGELVRTRWRVLQGFRMVEGGTTEPGPYGLTTETEIFLRGTYPHAAEPPAQLGQLVLTAADHTLAQVLGAVRWRLFKDENEEQRLQPLDKQQLAQALGERYAQSGAATRLLILAMMPPGRALRALAPFDQAVLAITEADPRVTLVKLATRVADRTEPALAAAESDANDAVRRVAAAMRTRLETNPKTYSRFTFFAQP